MLASLGLGGLAPAATEAALAAGVAEDMPIEDLVVGIASPMTLKLYGPDWVVLPLQLPLPVGTVLMVRAEFAEHSRTQALVSALLRRLSDLARDCPDVKVLRPAVISPDRSASAASLRAPGRDSPAEGLIGTGID